MQTETAESKNQILALEIRPRVTGFAVFDEQCHLLDWGRRIHRVKRGELQRVVAKKIAALLNDQQPSMIVVRMRNLQSSPAREKIRVILRVTRREAKKHSITVQMIPPSVIKQFFASRHCNSKHERSTLIARWYPELAWKLPPKRKVWKSEDHRMAIFDAVASALAFTNRSPPDKR